MILRSVKFILPSKNFTISYEFIIVDGIPHLLEVNTIPGLTAASLIPQQVHVAGIELADFFETLLTEAMKPHKRI